jgi:uncharacterized protein YbdZ (MbtH family)
VLAWWPTAISAVTTFARVYTNWTAADVSQRLRILAAASLGRARQEMAAQATETEDDPELASGHLTNQGTVEAVSPLAGQPGTYIVVTLERTVASAGSQLSGLPAGWHVTLAAVTRVAQRGWVVSDWRPQS